MKAISVAAMVFAAAVGLHAQTISLKANIPFEFNVGATVMPAGQYDVQHASGAVILRSQSENRKSVIALSQPAVRNAAEQPATLVFNRYGDQYFLSKIWDAYSTAGRVLGPGKHEKELIARGAAAQTAVVARSR